MRLRQPVKPKQMAQQIPIDIIRNLARQRAAGEPDLLVLSHTVEARPGERVSHLPVSQVLSQAWVTLTGAPFRPHQALALSALRRGEPFALLGNTLSAGRTIHLLFAEELLNDPRRSALLLVPERENIRQHLTDLRRLSDAIGGRLRLALVDEQTPAREAVRAQIIVTDPQTLHQRLLRHHDRAWRPFWERLSALLLAEVDQYSGVAAAHLSGLLLRSLRLTIDETPPLLAATLAEVGGAEEALLRLSGLQWRTLNVQDVPHPAATLAVWQAGHNRLRETATLSQALHREGYRTHIICEPLEQELLRELLRNELRGITIGAIPQPADVHVFAGYPALSPLLLESLQSGARLTLLVLGVLPVERTLARLSNQLVNNTPPTWAPAPLNAYIEAQHLLCAASERPLSVAEVAAWQAERLVNRLQDYGQIVRLPADQAAWQPLPAAGDPYAAFGLRAVGSAAITISNEQHQRLATFDPAAFDRWAFPGAALPACQGGYRVVARDEDQNILTVRAEQTHRRTLPLRTCNVNMRERDERESRLLRGVIIGWGRVLIEEEVYGYRETVPDSAPTEQRLKTVLSTRWTAPALWLDLPMRLKSSAQFIGWSLVAAVPLCVRGTASDLVPAYDGGLGRLYLVDAQPGGNGLARWLYDELEIVLPLAYDVALDSRNDALMEPTARLDMDWLLALLGGPLATTKTAPAQPPANHRPAPEPRPTREPVPTTHKPASDSQSSSQSRPAPTRTRSHPADDTSATSEQRQQRNQSEQQREPEAKPARTRQPKSTKRAAPPEPAAQSETEPSPRKRSRRKSTASTDEQPAAQSSAKTTRSKTTKPAAPPPAPEPTPTITPPDADAILARLQSLRAKNEAPTKPAAKPERSTSTNPAVPPTPRFQIGDHVICRPYGEGVVRATRFDKGQELVTITFPDHGDLEINPSINMVRHLDVPDAEADDAF